MPGATARKPSRSPLSEPPAPVSFAARTTSAIQKTRVRRRVRGSSPNRYSGAPHDGHAVSTPHASLCGRGHLIQSLHFRFPLPSLPSTRRLGLPASACRIYQTDASRVIREGAAYHELCARYGLGVLMHADVTFSDKEMAARISGI